MSTAVRSHPIWHHFKKRFPFAVDRRKISDINPNADMKREITDENRKIL